MSKKEIKEIKARLAYIRFLGHLEFAFLFLIFSNLFPDYLLLFYLVAFAFVLLALLDLDVWQKLTREGGEL